ncbi:MAG: hypothetical protein ABIK25_07205 [Pseudomonadota bacterium]
MKALTLLPIVVALAACGGGGSNDSHGAKGQLGLSGEVSKKVTEEHSSEDTDKETVTGSVVKEVKATVPGQMIINGAMARTSSDPYSIKMRWIRKAKEGRPFVSPDDHEALQRWAKGLGEDEVAKAAQALVVTDPETAAAMCEVMSLAVVAVAPVLGYEIPEPPEAGGKFDTPFFWSAKGFMSKKDVDDARLNISYYQNLHERAACAANKVGAKIGERVARRIYPAVAEIRHGGVVAAAEILPADSKSVLKKCAEVFPLKVKRLKDASGEKGIAWNLSLKRIECGKEGCSLIVGGKSGSTEFGGGNYGGTKYEFALGRSGAVTTEQTISTSDKGSDDNSKQVRGTVGVSN